MTCAQTHSLRPHDVCDGSTCTTVCVCAAYPHPMRSSHATCEPLIPTRNRLGAAAASIQRRRQTLQLQADSGRARDAPHPCRGWGRNVVQVHVYDVFICFCTFAGSICEQASLFLWCAMLCYVVPCCAPENRLGGSHVSPLPSIESRINNLQHNTTSHPPPPSYPSITPHPIPRTQHRPALRLDTPFSSVLDISAHPYFLRITRPGSSFSPCAHPRPWCRSAQIGLRI
jgi:hypothetical protein